MRNLVAAIASLLVAGICLGQGLKPIPDNEYNALPRYAPTETSEIVTRTVNGQEVSEVRIVDGPLPPLPPAVDLTPFAPAPGYQTFEDCTAWATAYCCLSTQNASLRGINRPSESVDLFSPRFVYSQINGGSDSGSYIFRPNMGPDDSAVGLFQTRGCSSNLLTPYIPKSQNSTGWATLPNNNSFVEAANYPLFQHTKCETVDDIRYALVFGIPVVIAAYTEPSFDSFSGPGIYTWGGIKQGRHAMCIIGYDNVRQAFRVQNSWGQNWGDQGRFWVGYNAFTKLNTPQRNDGWCYEAHAIILSFHKGTQLRSTTNPTVSYYFTPDGGVLRKSDGVRIAAPGQFRAVESTGYYLYGLTNNGDVQYFHGNHWDEITSATFPQGLSGGKAKMMAASGRFLYIITKAGNICGRVPGNQSSSGFPYWEKINLPNGNPPIDIRFRNGDIYVEADDGSLYKRIAGSGWDLQN
ncbi:peptidase C1A papain [Rhodopirellula maiorica SM1]|uniref:Peptidase C1A papain n=1 Tax=Rhodopirellula maiorica SM1 TaxID=1265738 RepID=M5S4T8_9BACT|nr:C1 family peptidase [Rhodopirellula maiorica]EMI22657.1 peptidase C1A papain [Rhodopirellula maiorica SM1]